MSESEIAFEKLKDYVRQERKKHPSYLFQKDGSLVREISIPYLDGKTAQNIVEAAIIDGADPDKFLKRMMSECECDNIADFATEHGDQGGFYKKLGKVNW